MQIVFDKELSTRYALNFNYFGESISRHTLSASMSKTLTAADIGVPELQNMPQTFSTVHVVDGNIEVPIQGDYNRVVDASAAYNSASKEYSATIILGYVEGQTAEA